MSRTVRALQRVVAPHDVLRAAGMEDDGFAPRHGWSNRAWVGRRFVVRISSGRLEGSFEHERRVSTELRAAGIPVAAVLANGLVSDLPGSEGEAGEWIVTARLAGDTLASVWSDLDDASRSTSGRSLGEVIRAVHEVDRRRRPSMVRAARDLGDADHALLDWEGAHKVAADRELDMLLRWAAAAHDFSESPGLPSRITAGDCIRLVEDVATAYPASSPCRVCRSASRCTTPTGISCSCCSTRTGTRTPRRVPQAPRRAGRGSGT